MSMRRGIVVAVIGILTLVVLAVAPSVASSRGLFKADLSGYQENPAISTTGTGSFRAMLQKDGMALDYELSYSGLEGGDPLFAHIHLGARAVNGGVIAFLCGGGGKPACPTEGTVTGTITPDDVIGPAGQGIAAGEFDELIRAMRAGAAYANLHTPTWPAGEIRGQISGPRG